VGRQERLATLGTVAAGVAHEVRNPLGALQAIFPRLKATLRDAGGLDVRTEQALDVAVDSLGRIERVTRDLLDLSRVDREPTATWDANEAVAAAVRLLEARGVKARVEMSLGAVAPVFGRAAELSQIVLNVVDNAVKAAGPDGRVVVATRLEKGELHLTVTDDGPGIPPEVRARVFTPFFTTRVGGEGTGLGLAIARRIVQDHLGRIEVVCPPEGGTRIEVVLPAQSGEAVRAEARA
jgi:signal transduction histidine kinase